MCVFYDVFSHFKENKRPRYLLIQGGLTSKIQKTWYILQVMNQQVLVNLNYLGILVWIHIHYLN
jgi:hypothetical protein